MSRSIEIAEGTLYPLLRKLKNDGMCETYLSDESGGPPRKYYRLIDKGREAGRRLRQEWENFTRNVALFMEDDDE